MHVHTTEETQQQLRDLAERWADAELRGDTETLRTLLTEDFVGVAPRGFVLGKRDWLERYDSKALEHSEFTWDEVEIHLRAGLAIMTALHRARGLHAGEAFDGRWRGMLVLVHSGPGWRIYAAQHSPISDPPPRLHAGPPPSPRTADRHAR